MKGEYKMKRRMFFSTAAIVQKMYYDIKDKRGTRFCNA